MLAVSCRLNLSLVCAGFFVVGLAQAAQASPIVVSTMSDLVNIQNNLAGDYVLGGNIDATGSSFSPIATSSPFTGSLNGNGFGVSNLSINATGQYLGMFGQIGSTGQIIDLKLNNVNVMGAVGASGTAYVGTLAGLNEGNITGAYVSGAVAGFGSSACDCGFGGEVYVGGIAGVNSGGAVIGSSQAVVDVSGSKSNFLRVGGIAGQNSGLITGTSRSGAVSGGNTGNNNALYTLGGIAGSNIVGTIENSSASGTVTHTAGSDSVGGVAGFNNGTVSRSFSTAAVTGSDNAGGLVGWNAHGQIQQSYALGSVNGTSGAAGGLVALSDVGGSITQSYAAGPVTAASGLTAGLVQSIGNGGSSITNSYWDTQSTGQPASAAGTGLTTSQLKSGSLPAGFDPAVWRATADQYPQLQWQPSFFSHVVMTFEGLKNGEFVDQFYDGGTGSLGSPGRNFGVSWSGALACTDSDVIGGNGCNVANEPSPSTVMAGTGGFGYQTIMNAPNGFNTIKFDYSQQGSSANFEIYSGLNATGTLISRVSLHPNNMDCTGDPTGTYCEWETFYVPVTGIGKSAKFDAIFFDNVEIDSLKEPNQAVADPRLFAIAIGFDDQAATNRVRGDLDAQHVLDALKLNVAWVTDSAINLQAPIILNPTSIDGLQQLTAALSRLSSTITPQDTLVFYYSGHGWPWGTSGGGVNPGNETPVTVPSCSVCSNFAGTNTADEIIQIGSGDPNDAATGRIVDDQLTALFNTDVLKGVRKLFLLDACYSGGFWGDPLSEDVGDLERLSNAALLASSDELHRAPVEGDGTGTGMWTNNVLLPILNSGNIANLSLIDVEDLMAHYVADLNRYHSGEIHGLKDFFSEDTAPFELVPFVASTADFANEASLLPSVVEPTSMSILAAGLCVLLAWRMRGFLYVNRGRFV